MLVPHALGEIQLSSVLNFFLTLLPWASVPTGKLDFRFPVQPSSRLSKQFQAVWNTNSPNDKSSEDFQKFSKQTGSHPNVNNQLAKLYKLVKNEVNYKFLYTLIFKMHITDVPVLYNSSPWERSFSWSHFTETLCTTNPHKHQVAYSCSARVLRLLQNSMSVSIDAKQHLSILKTGSHILIRWHSCEPCPYKAKQLVTK